MNIIDCHTHVLLDESAWMDFLAEMRRNDTIMAVVSGLGVKDWPRYPDAVEVRGANDMSRRFCEMSQGMCIWLGYINPQLPNALEELERCVKEGCRGVKLWISLKDEKTGSIEATYPILKRAEELGLPVKIHTFFRTEGNLSGEVNIQETCELARKFPKVNILAAHAGANWRASCGILKNAAKELPNLYVDICGSMPVKDMCPELCSWIGTDHVLYGSDGLGRSFASQIAKVTCSSLSDAEKQAVFFDNSVKFYKISADEIAAAKKRFQEIKPNEKTQMIDSASDNTFIIDLPGDVIFRNETFKSAMEFETKSGVSKVYATYGQSFFAWNLISVNREFLRNYGCVNGLVPLATLNPSFVDWQYALDDAIAAGFQGGVLLPYVQNWNLSDDKYDAFFKACAEKKFPLWINMRVYDYRFHHPVVACRPVSTDELKTFLDKAPANSYVFQSPEVGEIGTILASGRQDIKVDISRLLDCTGWLARMEKEYGIERMVFGSEYPVRNIETNRFILDEHCKTID